MPKHKHHIFVCQNTRPKDNPKGSCNPNEDFHLIKMFKDAVKAHGINAEVKATKSGCLDQCEHGPTVVIYPDAIWYGFVQDSDVNEIVLAVKEGRIVTKNQLADGCISTPSCEHKVQKTISDKTK